MFSKYEDLIIRPPRTVPLPSDLGPVKTAHFEREEFRLVNARGQALFGTLIRPTNSKTSDGNNDNTNRSCPVLVYAHANASNRARALEWRSLLVEELGAVLVAFDFAGCGESEGQYISLGVHEAQDLACVLDFVEEQLKGSPIVLCGRSMGSAAVMMYAAQHIQKHPFVVGLIFDGVFESLRSLMTDLAKQSSVLGLLAPLGVPLLRRRIQQKADFDIDELDLVEKARMVGIPALFFVAKADELFPRKHMDHVFSAYKGSDKTLVDIEGGHNDFRGDDFWRAACSFLCRLWNLPPIPIADGMQVAQVLPFVLQGEELEPARDEFVPGPLSVDVQRDCIKFFPLFRKADTEPVWTFRYTSFVGMDSGPARKTVSEKQYFLFLLFIFLIFFLFSSFPYHVLGNCWCACSDSKGK